MSKDSQTTKTAKKKPTKIFDLEARKIFFKAYRGKAKGTLNPNIRKRIDRGLMALEEEGYV